MTTVSEPSKTSVASTRTLKAALIGTGRIARQHLECLRALSGVEVAAVCDLSPAMAESAADRFGVPRWYTSHATMLTEIKPDVVHITTPPPSHFPLAMAALDSGANVFVEKPITASYDDLAKLLARARETGGRVIEDYNYVFNGPIQSILRSIESGEFGSVTHVEVLICLDILGKGSVFTDPNAPHPCLTMPGGAIADFLTHLASLAYFFVGAHRSVRTVWQKRDAASPLPSDEFRALLECERGTASLGFSAHTQPDVFWVRVYGTKQRAATNLFEPRLTIDRMRGGPKPLMPMFNGLQEARDVRRSAFGGLWRKLSGGPGAYEGLWELLGRTYAGLQGKSAMPITPVDVEAINRLVADLTKKELQL